MGIDERLRRVASVAGYTVTKGSSGYREFLCVGGVEWNPEESDADAFRLAVRLGCTLDYALDQADTEKERIALMRKQIVQFALDRYEASPE